jgi:hypothetical protein
MDLDDPHFEDLWNRFRHVVQSVADAQTLRDLAQKRAHRAQSNAEQLRGQEGRMPGAGHDAPEMDAKTWQARHEQEDAKAQMLQAMLTYFISHPSPSLPPPRFEELEADAKSDMARTYDLIGEPKKKREIYDAIRRVLDREDVPGGKIKFYKAADKERGLSGKGRATENWVRDNERDPLPGPDYWREKFNL